MAEQTFPGRLPGGIVVSIVRDDVQLGVTAVVIVNSGNRTVWFSAGGRTISFPPGTNLRSNFPSKVAYTEEVVTRPDGKQITNWLPPYRMWTE